MGGGGRSCPLARWERVGVRAGGREGCANVNGARGPHFATVSVGAIHESPAPSGLSPSWGRLREGARRQARERPNGAARAMVWRE